MDQSLVARAKRRAVNDALLQQQLREGMFIGGFVMAVVLVTIGAIGRALGWW